MEHLAWPSIGLYCVFSVFVNYQQLHASNFHGASEAFGFFLNIFAFAGMVIGLSYLVYYGWKVVWWAPFVIFVLGILSFVPGLFLERIFGKNALSLLGFIVWPICAYYMFMLVPA